MPKQINDMSSQRYHNPEIIEHLASQYVLGTLTTKVHDRVASIAQHNEQLELAISNWQERFIGLDHKTPELVPSETSWANIADQLGIESTYGPTPNVMQTSKPSLVDIISSSLERWFTVPINRYASVFSVALLMIVTLLFNPMADKNDPLSYVAVLTQQSGQAHIVASTYGESKKLIVNVVATPEMTQAQSLELWVVSKTDSQARSLGVIPTDTPLVEQQLTEAQWRLIKDSESLIVTIEDNGGSAIGEPSEQIVSRGLCVRLQDWKKNA